MPANKNALIRYKTIDNCLRNPYRRWTLDDLVDACCEALLDAEGISKGVSVRTVQADIQMMRSDKLGYNAPIEVYEHKFYRYADRNYSITAMPLSQNDLEVMTEAVNMLRELEDFDQFAEMSDVVRRLQDQLAIAQSHRRPVVLFDRVADLKGLQLLNPLYNYITQQQTLRITYYPFTARKPSRLHVCPYLLKEFRNRWFLFCANANTLTMYNLALDRIVAVKRSNKPFRPHPLFNPETFFDDVIGVTKNLGDKALDIVFWTSTSQSRYVKTKPIHRSQVLLSEDPADHSCVFRITVVPNFELYSVLMSYGAGLRVLQPTSVAEHMRDELRRAAAEYD